MNPFLTDKANLRWLKQLTAVSSFYRDNLSLLKQGSCRIPSWGLLLSSQSQYLSLEGRGDAKPC